MRVVALSFYNCGKHSPPGDRWPPDCLEEVLPVCMGGPLGGPPLTCDISGSISSNEEFSIWTLTICDALSYGMHAIAVR